MLPFLFAEHGALSQKVTSYSRKYFKKGKELSSF